MLGYSRPGGNDSSLLVGSEISTRTEPKESIVKLGERNMAGGKELFTHAKKYDLRNIRFLKILY